MCACTFTVKCNEEGNKVGVYISTQKTQKLEDCCKYQARLGSIARDWWCGESLLVHLSHFTPTPEFAFYNRGGG